jgi:hypothetical protein
MAITILDFLHTTQGTIMFTPQFYIDSFQNLKHSFTNKVITDPTLNKAANDFIDAQTAWAKMVVDNTTTITKYYFDKQSDIMYPKKDSK